MITEILQQSLIEREFYLKNIEKYLATPLVKVLIGQRRVGKSSILKSLIKKLYINKQIPKNNFFYINKELSSFDHIQNYQDLKISFQQFLQHITPGRIFVGIDEIQDINEWEKFINGILAEFGEQAEIFITGSNGFLLSGDLATYLTGRYIEFPIYPLSFSEFCLFKNEKKDKQNFIEYLQYGGLPGIFQLQYQPDTISAYLSSVYDSIVLKDIIMHKKIKEIRFFQDFYKYTFSNI